MDCNLPGFSVHGIFQARILERVAIPFSRGSSGPRDQWASLVAQTVKNLPVMQETWVPSLVWEDPLEEKMATHSSILAWKSHQQRSLVGYSPWGHKESNTTERLSLWLHNPGYNLPLPLWSEGVNCLE